jgi:hypothetical protein
LVFQKKSIINPDQNLNITFEDYVFNSFETFSTQAAEAHEKLVTKVKNINKQGWEDGSEGTRQLMMLNEYYLELNFGEIVNTQIAPRTINSESGNFSAGILTR